MPSREAQEDNGCSFSWIGSWAVCGKRNSPLDVIKNTCINILLWSTICRSLIFTDCVGSLGRPANSLSYQSEVPEVSWSEILGCLSLLVLGLTNKTQDKWGHWPLQTSSCKKHNALLFFLFIVYYCGLWCSCCAPLPQASVLDIPALSPAFVLWSGLSALELYPFLSERFILSINTEKSGFLWATHQVDVLVALQDNFAGLPVIKSRS